MSLWLPDNQLLLNDANLLKQVTSRYRRLLKNDNYVFWEWDLQAETYCCGGKLWEKLGYQGIENEVIDIKKFDQYIHPDDWEYINNIIFGHLRFNKPINMVSRIRAANGSYCWTQACASSTRDNNDRVTHLTGVNFDLSHIKEAEKELRLSQARHERVLASSNDGIWEWSATDANDNPNRAGIVGKLHTSHSFWAHLGYSEEEVDALPKNERLEIWRSHIHPADLPTFQQALMDHITSRTPIDVEYRMFGDGGRMFWVRTRGSGVFNSFGRMILMSGINIDITQIKESEERVRVAKEAAERANQSKSNFLSSVSHELRTPLNAILGFSRLLASDTALNQERRDEAHYIYNAGQYLLRLINDVLDLAQIEAGRLSLSMGVLEPAKLVEEAFHFCETMAQEKRVQLSLHTYNLGRAAINADSLRLQQCLLNLINNAIKYNHNDGVVDVVFTEVDGQLDILIQDSGPGVSAENQAFLFEMFNRLGAEQSSVQGSGIGLVISKQLAEAMGGSLVYVKGAGPGACFKLSFPLVSEALKPAMPIRCDADDDLKDMDLWFSETKKIVYIEDNESNIFLLKSWLDLYPSLELTVVSEPLIGLYQLRSSPPDLVLLDINLPGMSGYDILNVLKKDLATCDVPVVALSASAMERDVEQGLMMGFDEYLTKPLDTNRLAAVLNHFFVKQEL